MKSVRVLLNHVSVEVGTPHSVPIFSVGSSLGAGVLLLLITPLLKYLMHGKG